MFLLDRKCFAQRFRFSLHAMRDFAEAPGAVTVIAEANGALVGFTIAEVGANTAYLTTVDVDPLWRRRGVAGKMLGWIEEADPEIRQIELHVHAENPVAIGFYERLGFLLVGRVPDFYGRGVDAFGYRKILSP